MNSSNNLDNPREESSIQTTKDDITNINDINTEDVLNKLPEIRLKKRKKKVDEYSMDTFEDNFYKEFITKLENLREIHILSAQYYEQRSLMFSIPTILLTSFGGMASFLSASSFFNENSRIILSLGVGIIGSTASLLQSFQSTFKFTTKAEMFRNAAEQYDKLIVEIKFELARHNEVDFADKLEKKILEVQNNCKYFPPQNIVNKYYKQLESDKDKYKYKKNNAVVLSTISIDKV